MNAPKESDRPTNSSAECEEMIDDVRVIKEKDLCASCLP